MKNSELVDEIESQYNVHSIKYGSLNLWLELRNRVLGKITLGEESTLNITSQTYSVILLSVFYGFFNWFKKYDAWFFSSQVNRIKIEGKYVDRIFEYPALKFKRSLFIELTTKRHYKKSEVSSKYIVSRSLLIVIEKIIAKFIFIKNVNLTEYNRILKDYSIEVDASYGIKKMVSQYKLMNFILKFRKPKHAFVSPNYTCYGYVKALKDNNVKVIEIQHGVIIKQHFGYYLKADFDKSYFVDHLLTFGENEKNVFELGNNGITQQNVFAIGNYYLDYIQENHQISSVVQEIISNYSKSFVVSLQELDVPLKIIPEIISVANNNLDCIFILKPRKKDKSYYLKNYSFPKNVVVIDDINIYQLILDTDFHVTVYSTCALEAPALGKINILFNIENKAKDILGQSLTNTETTRYVNNSEEFSLLIKNIKKTDEAKVMHEHGDIICSGYKNRVSNFIKSIE